MYMLEIGVILQGCCKNVIKNNYMAKLMYNEKRGGFES